jgi:hypothetical protein
MLEDLAAVDFQSMSAVFYASLAYEVAKAVKSIGSDPAR